MSSPKGRAFQALSDLAYVPAPLREKHRIRRPPAPPLIATNRQAIANARLAGRRRLRVGDGPLISKTIREADQEGLGAAVLVPLPLQPRGMRGREIVRLCDCVSHARKCRLADDVPRYRLLRGLFEMP
jgi:hypothetical protein